MTGSLPPGVARATEVDGRRVASGAKPSGDFTYSVVEARPSRSGPWTGRERRGDARTPTRLRDGILGEHRRRVLAECHIRDRSRSGARIRLDSDQSLPRRFMLTDPASRRSFRATLVWQKGRDAGVRLVPLEGESFR